MTLAKQEYTLRELELMFGRHTPDSVRLNLMLAATHDERLAELERAIDWIAQEHSKTRQKRIGRDEDSLTIDVITDLKAMGFTAGHDVAYGGHGDIVVEERDDFLWIGEAKVHKGNHWLLEGFEQLDKRYSTGLPGQDNGGMIIYCRQENVADLMEKWATYLGERRTDVVVEATSAAAPLVRRSSHQHRNTGLAFRVRHVPFSLFFDPKV